MTTPNTNNVPQPVADAVLLYQAETALLKLAERSLLTTGLSAPQMLLLGALYHDGRALVPNRLRNTLVVEAQSLTGLIDRLENQGLAKRQSHPSDRRKIMVQITSKGRTRYDEATAVMQPVTEAFFKALNATERQSLRSSLMKLRGKGYPELGLAHASAYPPWVK